MPFQRRRSASPPVDERPIVASTIREIDESVRVPGRYRLTLSDGRTIVLSAGALADAGATRVGVVLAADAVQKLVAEAEVTTLADRALGYLARGRRSRRELELRLRQHQADPLLVARALDRLVESGAIDDAEVARAEAAARLRRGEGPAAVKRRLRGKGISDADTGAALADAVDTEQFDEDTACRTAADKRVRALRELPRLAAKRRLIAFLNRRGYRGEVIDRTVQDVLEGWVSAFESDGGDDDGDGDSDGGGD